MDAIQTRQEKQAVRVAAEQAVHQASQNAKMGKDPRPAIVAQARQIAPSLWNRMDHIDKVNHVCVLICANLYVQGGYKKVAHRKPALKGVSDLGAIAWGVDASGKQKDPVKISKKIAKAAGFVNIDRMTEQDSRDLYCFQHYMLLALQGNPNPPVCTPDSVADDVRGRDGIAGNDTKQMLLNFIATDFGKIAQFESSSPLAPEGVAVGMKILKNPVFENPIVMKAWERFDPQGLIGHLTASVPQMSASTSSSLEEKRAKAKQIVDAMFEDVISGGFLDPNAAIFDESTQADIANMRGFGSVVWGQDGKGAKIDPVASSKIIGKKAGFVNVGRMIEQDSKHLYCFQHDMTSARDGITSITPCDPSVVTVDIVGRDGILGNKTKQLLISFLLSDRGKERLYNGVKIAPEGIELGNKLLKNPVFDHPDIEGVKTLQAEMDRSFGNHGRNTPIASASKPYSFFGTSNTTTAIVLGVGGVAVVSGLVFYMLSKKK